MTERQVIVHGLNIHHSGFFSSSDIETFVEKHLLKKAYSLKSKEDEVIADPQNKEHIITVKYVKQTSEYDKSVLKITFHFSQISKKYILKNKRKCACEKGDVSITFRGISESKKEGFVGYTPIRYFFTYMRSKFITKKHDLVPGAGLEDDIKNLYDELYLYIKHTQFEEIPADDETQSHKEIIHGS